MNVRTRLPARPALCPSCGHDRAVKAPRWRWLRWLNRGQCREPVHDVSGWDSACFCTDPWHVVGT